MIRKDIAVKRPERTKIYRQKDCAYVYYVTGSEYKKDKQYVVEKRVCIGKMINDENMNPNDNFFQYFEIEGGIDEAIGEFEKVDIVKNSKDVYIRKYGLTAKQKKIFGQFGITESYINKVADRRI